MHRRNVDRVSLPWPSASFLLTAHVTDATIVCLSFKAKARNCLWEG